MTKATSNKRFGEENSKSHLVASGSLFRGKRLKMSTLTGVALASLAFATCCPASFADANDDKIVDQIESESQNEVQNSSIEKLQEILVRDPKNYKAHLVMAGFLDRMGLEDQAEEEYCQAVSYGPNDPKAIVELVKARFKRGQIDAAWALLREAQRKFNNDPEILYWVGNYMYKSKEIERAESMFVVALGSKKKVFGLHTALAAIRVRTRPGEALRFAEIDLAENPNYDLALRVKGFALMQLRQYERAAVPLKAVYEHDFKNEELSRNYAECLYWLGDYKTALDPALQNLCSTASPYVNNVESKLLLFKIMKRVPNDAIAPAVAKVVERNDRKGRHSAFYFALGDVLDGLNKQTLAIQQYRRGLKIDPEFARGYFRLGKDQLQIGHDEEALASYRHAYMLRPSDPEIGSAYRRLQDRLSIRDEDFAGAWKQWLKSKIRS